MALSRMSISQTYPTFLVPFHFLSALARRRGGKPNRGGGRGHGGGGSGAGPRVPKGAGRGFLKPGGGGGGPNKPVMGGPKDPKDAAAAAARGGGAGGRGGGGRGAANRGGGAAAGGGNQRLAKLADDDQVLRDLIVQKCKVQDAGPSLVKEKRIVQCLLFITVVQECFVVEFS